MTRFNLPIAILGCSIAASALAAPPDAPRYRLKQIVPDTPSSSVLAADLNNRGQVVGFVSDASGREHAFAWRNGTVTNIGPQLDPTATTTRANANNDRGDILGFFFGPSGEFATILLRRGEATQIHGLPGEVAAGAADINDRRQIAGGSLLEDGSNPAFIWEDGNAMLLPPLPGDSSAQVVTLNARGDVLGISGGPTGHIVIWEDAQPIDLNIPGAIPRDMNDRQQVVGTTQQSRGFLWERGVVTQLPILAGAAITQAASVNNAGEIVGTSNLESGVRATLWEDEQVFDLNDLIRSNDPLRPFVTLEEASLINDRGAIVATGRDSRAPIELRTYLLTPH